MSNPHNPHVIVLGNEKGGTGKSTLSMHIITHLLRMGYKVGSVDVDARQGTLSRYVENRQAFMNQSGITLPISTHKPIFKSELSTVEEAQVDETKRFQEALHDICLNDFIVIDTPGSDSFLSRLAHSYADTLITPLNDSFIDLDMLARVDPQTGEIQQPSTYAEMVWEQKKQRLMRDRVSADWIVVRNRLGNLQARNKQEMQKVLDKLSQRIGCRVASGFGERVIFRELFLKGLTLLDLKDVALG